MRLVLNAQGAVPQPTAAPVPQIDIGLILCQKPKKHLLQE